MNSFFKIIKNYGRAVFTLDTRSLAIFRIGLGVICLLDVLLRSRDFTIFYTNDGWMPMHVLFDLSTPVAHRWSLFFIHSSTAWAAGLFVATVIAAIGFAVGYYTKYMNVALWILILSIQARNPYVNYGMDQLLAVMLFWSMWLPLGSLWSVDFFQGRSQPYKQIYSGATIALLIQIVLIYWVNAVTKCHPMWRVDYTAVEYALRLKSFSTEFGQYLLKFPELLRVGTKFTIILEQVGPALLLIPLYKKYLRTGVVCLFVAFHLGMLATTMKLDLFPYACAVIWLSLLPSSFWSSCGKCPKLMQTNDYKQSKGALIFCTIFIAYTLLLNIRVSRFERDPWYLPKHTNIVLDLVRLNQEWRLFAPRPRTTEVWIVGEKIKGGYFYITSGEECKLEEGKWRMYSTGRQRGYISNMFYYKYNCVADALGKYVNGELNVEKFKMYAVEIDHSGITEEQIKYVIYNSEDRISFDNGWQVEGSRP